MQMTKRGSDDLANLKRRWQAEARLDEHELLCCGPQQGTNCPRFAGLERELAEASHE